MTIPTSGAAWLVAFVFGVIEGAIALGGQRELRQPITRDDGKKKGKQNHSCVTCSRPFIDPYDLPRGCADNDVPVPA